MSTAKPFPIPVSYFSISLGLLSLGLAWRAAGSLLGFPAAAGEGILVLGALSWLFFLLIYIYKWLQAPAAAVTELHDLVQCCFISLLPITTILMGLALLPYGTTAAKSFIAVGITACIFFAAYRSGGLWRGTHCLEATTPVIYLPTVAASFASATALATLGLNEIGWLFFGAGFFSWLGLEAAIQQRLRIAAPLPAAMRPVIGIQLAPPFVGCAAYLSLNGGILDLPSKLLIGYGLLDLLFLGRLLPWIMEKGFLVSLWAFSFGLGSMATVGVKIYHATGGKGLGILGLPFLGIGTILIVLLLLGTLYLISQRHFLVK